MATGLPASARTQSCSGWATNDRFWHDRNCAEGVHAWAGQVAATGREHGRGAAPAPGCGERYRLLPRAGASPCNGRPSDEIHLARAQLTLAGPDALGERPTGRLLFLAALLGLLGYFAVERSVRTGLATRPRLRRRLLWLNVTANAVLEITIGYLMVVGHRASGQLALLTVAMSLRALITDRGMYEAHRHDFDRYGRPVLLAAAPVSWLLGVAGRGPGLLARRGGSAVFLGRWVAFFRAVMPALAGTARMPYARFLVFNAAGGITWGAAVVLVGYAAGASYARSRRASAAVAPSLSSASPSSSCFYGAFAGAAPSGQPPAAIRAPGALGRRATRQASKTATPQRRVTEAPGVSRRTSCPVTSALGGAVIGSTPSASRRRSGSGSVSPVKISRYG